MKTLQEIKSDYALELGYLTWGLLLEDVSGTVVLLNHMNEVAKRYAKDCCIASLEKAATSKHEVDIFTIIFSDKERTSITNPENIVLC